MFNYLAKTEDEFFENWDGIQKEEPFPYSVKYFLKVKLFFLQQLFVPFSQNSFTPDNFVRFIANIKQDKIYMLVNFVTMYSYLNDNVHDTESSLIAIIILQLFSPIIISFGAIDLTFNLSVFLLSLVTRSIASLVYMLVYMLDYSLNPQTQNQDNKEDDYQNNEDDYQNVKPYYQYAYNSRE